MDASLYKQVNVLRPVKRFKNIDKVLMVKRQNARFVARVAAGNAASKAIKNRKGKVKEAMYDVSETFNKQAGVLRSAKKFGNALDNIEIADKALGKKSRSARFIARDAGKNLLKDIGKTTTIGAGAVAAGGAVSKTIKNRKDSATKEAVHEVLEAFDKQAGVLGSARKFKNAVGNIKVADKALGAKSESARFIARDAGKKLLKDTAKTTAIGTGVVAAGNAASKAIKNRQDETKEAAYDVLDAFDKIASVKGIVRKSKDLSKNKMLATKMNELLQKGYKEGNDSYKQIGATGLFHYKDKAIKSRKGLAREVGDTAKTIGAFGAGVGVGALSQKRKSKKGTKEAAFEVLEAFDKMAEEGALPVVEQRRDDAFDDAERNKVTLPIIEKRRDEAFNDAERNKVTLPIVEQRLEQERDKNEALSKAANEVFDAFEKYMSV